jgi:hypothetical protein
VVDPTGRLGSLAYDLRDEEVVRRAGHLIVVWTATRLGGTFYTVCAAGGRGVPVQFETLEPSGTFDARTRGV